MTGAAPPPPPTKPMFLTPVVVSYTDADVVKAVPHTSYGAIAFEVALGVIPDEQIARTWNISLEMFYALKQTEMFQVELARNRKALQDQGKTAGFATRAKMIVEKALPGMYDILTSPNTRPEDRLRLFEKFVRFAGLDPDLNKKDGPSVMVQMNFSSEIRGLQNIKVVEGE